MAAAVGANQQEQATLERAFAAKSYKFGNATIATRAQQLAQQLQMTPESFANQYDSYALISEWNMDVTAQRLKTVADYLESELRKENARPRTAAAGGSGGSAVKALPLAMKPTWEDLPDKLNYPTPSAKRQALDPAAVNPGTGSKAAGTGTKSVGRTGVASILAGTPQPTGPQARQGGAATPLGADATAGTPSAPTSAFALRTNQGQVMAVLHGHLPGPADYRQLQQRGAGPGLTVRALGQPPLDTGGLLFMMELLETKVQALDERIMDFADALTAASRHTAAAAAPPTPGSTAIAIPGTVPTPAGTPPPAAPPTPGAVAQTPGTEALQGDGSSAAAVEVQPLHHSVADISHQPVWVAGRVLAETEGAPLNAESLLLEGCREASGGARVRLDVSCLPAFRLFPGQSVCAYGLNPTGGKFIAQRLVTHVPPPPPPPPVSAPSAAAGPDAAASREGGLSLVVAAGPYCLNDDLYSPLEELLSYCTVHPPDLLMLLGPFVDCEHPGLVSGAADRTADALFREEVLQRLTAWRADHPAAAVALMPAVRDATAMPVLPQPPMTAAVQAVGPADKAVALQNPATVSVGPVVVAACSADVLKALSASELSRVPPGTQVDRMPALASHVLGQRSFFPLYPAPPGSCLDTCHYSQLQLPVAPDLLLMPSDLAPFAKVLPPSTWAAGAPPRLLEATVAGGSSGIGGGGGAVVASASAAPMVVVNPGRLSRGGAGGTFAHVVVAPGPGPVLERTRVEVKKV